jgi:hypothetical protein
LWIEKISTSIAQRMIHAVVGPAVRSSNRSFVRAAYPTVALLIAVLVSANRAEAASRSATLEAIHKLENPRNSPKPGRHGELGAYQFRSSTWRMHTSVPFQRALDRDTSDAIAVKHYEWIKKGLEAARVPATPYYIALAWNGGLSAAVSGRAPRVAHDYAQRAANLASAFDIDRSQLIAAVESTSGNIAVGAQ